MPPATVAASTAFVSASRSGESPASIALVPLSDAARVARPNRDQRYSAHRTAAASMTMPVSQNRSTGIRVRGDVDRGRWGARTARLRPPPPVMSSTVACAMSSTPSDATSFDSGDELRSGRNTTS